MTIVHIFVIVAYLFIGACFGRGMSHRLWNNWGRHTDYKIAAFCMGASWPIFLPIMAGLVTREWAINRERLPSKDVQRRQREIAEAEHKLALAKIEAKAIEVSEQNAGMLR